MSIKTIRNTFIIVSLVILIFGIGYQLGENKNNSKDIFQKEKITTTSQADLTLFWDVWGRLSNTFIDKKKLVPAVMMDGAIAGMVSSLGDPYSVYLPPKQNKETKEDLGGKFEGIGAQLGMKEKNIVVIAPLPETPAERAGIKSGDLIIKINNKSTEGMTLPEAVSKIRGPKGTMVTLEILAEKATKTKKIEIKRETILVKSVEWSFLNDKLKEKNQNFEKTAYLKLSKFGDETENEWDKAIQEIRDKIDNLQINGLILDLRNNPGGYLDGAIYISSEFIKEGVVVYQENALGEKKPYLVSREGRLLDIPLVVLINRGSASASEIVSGALRDHERAKLVGEKTFGKGSIQESQDLPNGGGLHITTAKWLMPNGEWINGKGIKPEVEVLLDEKKPEVDTQLIKAGEILQ